MSSRKDLALGLFIVGAGVVIFLGKLGVFGFLGRTLWPLIVVLPGIFLHLLYFSRRATAGILIPGGILTVYGLLFLICNFAGWGLMSSLWPILILGVGVGLFEYYLFEIPRPGGALPIALGLTALSVLILFFTWLSSAALYIIAFLLIASGVWMIVRRNSSGRNNKWSRGW